MGVVEYRLLSDYMGAQDMKTMPDVLGRVNSSDLDRKCAQCGKPFTKMLNGAGYKYCSRLCMQRSKVKWHDKPGVKEYRHLYYIQKRYGVNPDEHAAMLKEQGGKCAMCGKSITHGGNRNRQLDHCHRSGKPRGILCPRCNTGLANLNDDPGLLRKGIEYLTK